MHLHVMLTLKTFFYYRNYISRNSNMLEYHLQILLFIMPKEVWLSKYQNHVRKLTPWFEIFFYSHFKNTLKCFQCKISY